MMKIKFRQFAYRHSLLLALCIAGLFLICALILGMNITRIMSCTKAPAWAGSALKFIVSTFCAVALFGFFSWHDFVYKPLRNREHEEK